jgi:hypothetical protein
MPVFMQQQQEQEPKTENKQAAHGDNDVQPADVVEVEVAKQLQTCGEECGENCWSCHGARATGESNGAAVVEPRIKFSTADREQFEALYLDELHALSQADYGGKQQQGSQSSRVPNMARRGSHCVASSSSSGSSTGSKGKGSKQRRHRRRRSSLPARLLAEQLQGKI